MSYRPIRIYRGPMHETAPAPDGEPGMDGKPYDVLGMSASYSGADARRLGNLLVEAGLTERVSEPFFRPIMVSSTEDLAGLDKRIPEGNVSSVMVAVEPPLPDSIDGDTLAILRTVVDHNIDTANGMGGMIDNRVQLPGEDMLGGQHLFNFG